jgi:hypothetical protein
MVCSGFCRHQVWTWWIYMQESKRVINIKTYHFVLVCFGFSFFFFFPLFFFFFGYFLYLHFKCYPLSRSPFWKPPIPWPLPLPLWGCTPTHPPTHSHLPTPAFPPCHSPNLRHRIPSDPRASPPTDAQQGHPLSHMLPEPWVLPCTLWLVVQFPGAQGSLAGWYCCSSPWGCNPLSFFSLLSNSSIGNPELSPMVGFKYLPLYLSGSTRASHTVAKPGRYWGCREVPADGSLIWLWFLKAGFPCVSLGCPETNSGEQAGSKLGDLTTSTSWVLGLKTNNKCFKKKLTLKKREMWPQLPCSVLDKLCFQGRWKGGKGKVLYNVSCTVWKFFLIFP